MTNIPNQEEPGRESASFGPASGAGSALTEETHGHNDTATPLAALRSRGRPGPVRKVVLQKMPDGRPSAATGAEQGYATSTSVALP